MSSNTILSTNIPNPFQAGVVSVPSAESLRHESQIPMPSFSQNTISSTNGSSTIINESEKRRRNSTGLSSMINKSITDQRNDNQHIKKRSRTTLAGTTGSNSQSLNNNEIRRRSLPSNNLGILSLSENTASAVSRKSNRLSSFGLINPQQQSQQGNLSNRDPRPLRDRNFQNAIQQEIIDYLLQNKFDIETNHPVSIKSLKQPTQKGFIIIFKWLYLRLDPGFKFTKSIEYDIYQILKNLQYPYLETINKSQISAVGGSSWHKFLGMLHWLVKVNIKLEEAANELDMQIVNQPTQEMITVNKPVRTLEQQDQIQEKYELMVENLFIDYITESYKNFLHSDDDYNVVMDKLSIGFEKFTHIIESDINNLNSQNEIFFQKYQYIQDNSKKFNVSRQKYDALRSDLNKFQKYINSMESKSTEWPTKLSKMQTEFDTKNNEINEIESQIRRILQDLDSRGLSLESIDDKIKEKENLISKLDKISDQCDKLTGNIKAKKYDNNGLIRNLMNVLKQYDVTLEKIFQDRESVLLNDKIENKQNFKIILPESKLSNINESDVMTYKTLFDSDVDSSSILETQKTELLRLNHEINLRIEKITVENNYIKDEILKLKDDVNDKNQESQGLEKALSQLKSEIVSQRQRNESDFVLQKIEIEELQSKNQHVLKTIDNKIKDAENLLEEKNREFEFLKINLNEQTESIKTKMDDIISYSTDFKAKIETSINSTKDDILETLKEIEKFKLNE